MAERKEDPGVSPQEKAEEIRAYVRQKCEEYYCYSVYMHTLPDNKIYIGYCKGNPNNRWRNGANYAGHKEFYAAIQEYGWENIKHDLLAEHLSREEAQERERFYILAYESYKPEIGYNREVPAAHTDKNHFSVYQLLLQ